MKRLKRCFKNDNENYLQYGNLFLIGNGHLGYRGTLEEYQKDKNVSFNVVGLYDKYQNKWRESVNVPNPLFIQVFGDDKLYSTLNQEADTKLELDIEKAVLKRQTDFKDLVIKTERFITEDDILVCKYQIKAYKDMNIKVEASLDLDTYDINGPHFKEKEVIQNGHKITFRGKTNEGKTIYEHIEYRFPKSKFYYEDGKYYYSQYVKSLDTFTFYIFAKVSKEKTYKGNFQYLKLKQSHCGKFQAKWDMARINIRGKKDVQFLVDYSIYHLLILGTDKYMHSIPARGVSGQVYKGAIFWDTEIFLLPFFTLTNPVIAKNLLLYRIQTLKGAKQKAKSLGYDGAFYAWESQDSGKEACSKYNITDPITGKKIRTYFNESQIHISFDIVYGILNYMNVTKDCSILNEGALDIFYEVYLFAKSYADFRNGKYHFDKVIGPDEYHERINDNAFTNYLAYFVIRDSAKYMSENRKNEMIDFANSIYLTQINNNGLIEQFDGYFSLKDLGPQDVKKMLRVVNDYWGFVAKDTRCIKQADIIALLALFPNEFGLDVVKANYDFYEPYTEHGSSLSASMYSLVASKIGKLKFAYEMFLRSASIEFSSNQKMFAGGIYIGGTHPASNAGAYLSLVFGFAGLGFNSNGIVLKPHLPKEIKELSFKIYFQNKKYQIHIFDKDKYEITEVL